jgi:hypothetical protein
MNVKKASYIGMPMPLSRDLIVFEDKSITQGGQGIMFAMVGRDWKERL